jgi:hypothetical protein
VSIDTLFGPAGNNAVFNGCGPSEECPGGPGHESCGIYRYELNRVWDWDNTLPVVGWIMLNPSTATATVNDPTINRCIGFTKTWGYGGLVVRNLFALRATDPRGLIGHPDPVGPDNAMHLKSAVHDAFTVCAWGSHRMARDLGRDLIESLRTDVDLRCLVTNKDGSPKHPLYVRGDAQPVPFGRSA